MKTKLVLLAAVLLTLTACNQYEDFGVNIGPAVFGVAVDAATNEPLSGVRVEVGGLIAESGVTGSYYVGEVPKGTHTLKATKAGYATFTAEVAVNDSMVEKRVTLSKQ
jgi:hypothetical protein